MSMKAGGAITVTVLPPKRGRSDLSRLCYKQEASYRNVLAFCLQMKRNFALLQATGYRERAVFIRFLFRRVRHR